MASLDDGISSQKRSGMARVVKGSHSFTCTRMRLCTNGIDTKMPAFAFKAEAGPQLSP